MVNKWLVVEVEENDKFYAYIVAINESDNILSKLDIKGIVAATFYNTKNKAERVTRQLIQIYRNKGIYMFDYPLF